VPINLGVGFRLNKALSYLRYLRPFISIDFICMGGNRGSLKGASPKTKTTKCCTGICNIFKFIYGKHAFKNVFREKINSIKRIWSYGCRPK
jgi:hypothetical protein